jgi:hypothetical protein
MSIGSALSAAAGSEVALDPDGAKNDAGFPGWFKKDAGFPGCCGREGLLEAMFGALELEVM